LFLLPDCVKSLMLTSVLSISLFLLFDFFTFSVICERHRYFSSFVSWLSCFLYWPGHRRWWRVWHVTMWGVLSRTRGHGRRFMEPALYSEHSRLSPVLCVIDMLNNGRSGGLTSPRGAHRRISQWTRLKLLEAQKSKLKRIVSVRWLLRQHRAWRSCGLKGTACPSATGFPEWTFAGGKVPSARTCLA